MTRDATAEPVSRDQIPRRERGQENIHFPRSADHEQDWQLYPADPCSFATCVTIHTYIIILYRRELIWVGVFLYGSDLPGRTTFSMSHSFILNYILK